MSKIIRCIEQSCESGGGQAATGQKKIALHRQMKYYSSIRYCLMISFVL